VRNRCDAWDPALHYRLMNKYRFLLVSLNIHAILGESTIHRRREQLSKITDVLGLGGAYCRTIERIKAQGGGKSRLGIAALMWVSHVLSFSEKVPIVYKEAQERIKRRRRGTKWWSNTTPARSQAWPSWSDGVTATSRAVTRGALSGRGETTP